MSKFTQFMKKNKIQKENTTYAPTKSLLDSEGNPLLWTIKPISTKENDNIRDACTIEVAVAGKPNMFRPKLSTSQYVAAMISSCVLEPNLNDKELQDSYGVMSAEELIKEMVNQPGEYGEFAAFVQHFNGFTTTMDDKVAEAKN